MKKKGLFAGMLVMVIVWGVVIVSCDIDATKLYTCYNYSSYSVTVTNADDDGISIAKGSSKSIYLLGETTLADIYYKPSNLVSVSLSGQSIYFRDR